MSKRLVILSAAFAIFLSETSLGDGGHQIFELGDFHLESGKILPAAKLSYVTHGQLNDPLHYNVTHTILFILSLVMFGYQIIV